MELTKTRAQLPPEKSSFSFSDKTVQGARVGKNGADLYICSPRRFKLYAEGCEKLCIVAGEGFLKWARGEIAFRAGDCFLADRCGEYEVNGNSEFAVLRGSL